ncbi:MAG: Rho termination factor N-terminal domain-containing protein [Ktedonobacteraceae bacterium]
MKTRMTIDQLEQMKTHELADMLASIVLLLRRMPDVECKQLVQQVPSPSDVEEEQRKPVQVSTFKSSFTREELAKRTVVELKTLAKDLNVLLPAKGKKDDLIEKILARPVDGHSEQRAIRDM